MTSPLRSSACHDFRQGRVSRRQLLQVGGLGLLGLNLPGLLRAAEANRGRRGKAKAVIFLHQFGGPSHLDTFDMKPAAPDNIRGEFKPIASKAAGIQVCELLPRVAQVADKFTLLRSLNHTMKSHNPATYYSLTGHVPPLDDIRLRDTPELFPAYGSVVDLLSPARGGMPSFVAFPHVLRDGSVTPGQHASFLGKSHSPLLITEDPNSPEFRLPELSLPADLSPGRLDNRKQVLRLIDEQTELMETSATAQGIDKFYDKALTMLTRPQVKRAFDLSAEPEAVRERFGRTTYGQGCLLARRLVEAGCRFVNVYFSNSIGGQSFTSGGWDTHGFNGNPMYPIIRKNHLPLTDIVLSALLEDLDARGLLDETLVVWMGEFGRSPRINSMAGRDHWPQCYTALLAGGGVKRGAVHGASDRTGAAPASEPVKPDDLAATIFAQLGIDPTTEIHDALNRPFPIAQGSPISGLLA
jgi:uncharacterized protein (DUF1501 family)